MPESYWDNISTVYRAVSIYEGADVLARDLKKLSQPQVDLLAAHWFMSEVFNGGVLQFFLNPTGVLAPESRAAFSNIGLEPVATIIEGSMARLGSIYPRDRQARTARICALAGVSEPSEAFSCTAFAADEEALYRFGGKKLDRVFDRMDAYAKETKG
jgi:hypothetical protein